MTPQAAIEQRIERVPESGCWLWLRCTSNGYGVFVFKGERYLAHRFSYLTFVGAIPDGLFVCHHCDVRECLNPTHLFVGTNQDNVDDCVSKGRLRPGRQVGSQNGRAKLTDDDVIAIRALYATGALQKDIGAQFGVGQTRVSAIIHRKQWSHVA